MTVQFLDEVEYDGRTWTITGMHGGHLFRPWDHDIESWSICTACWRGYHAQYAFSGDSLRLRELSVGSPKPGQTHPPLSGRRAARDGDDWIYRGLDRPVDFTGWLLVGDDFLEDLHWVTFYTPAWKFDTVFELECHAGVLVTAQDRSEDVRAFREQAGLHRGRRDINYTDDNRAAFARLFERRYDLSALEQRGDAQFSR